MKNSITPIINSISKVFVRKNKYMLAQEVADLNYFIHSYKELEEVTNSARTHISRLQEENDELSNQIHVLEKENITVKQKVQS